MSFHMKTIFIYLFGLPDGSFLPYFFYILCNYYVSAFTILYNHFLVLLLATIEVLIRAVIPTLCSPLQLVTSGNFAP